MKIGLVSAYDYAHPGGVTEHVRYLAAGLRRRGHDVTVFAPCSDKALAERDSDFIRVGRPFPIPMHGSVARITVSLHLTNRIKHYVREGGFDVIHYHEPLMPVLPVRDGADGIAHGCVLRHEKFGAQAACHFGVVSPGGGANSDQWLG